MMILNSEKVLRDGTDSKGRKHYLLLRPAGTYPAGAGTVTQRATLYVACEIDGTRHSYATRSPRKARALFARRIAA